MLPQVRLPPEHLPAAMARELARVGCWRVAALDGAGNAGLVPASVGGEVGWAVEYLETC